MYCTASLLCSYPWRRILRDNMRCCRGQAVMNGVSGSLSCSASWTSRGSGLCRTRAFYTRETEELSGPKLTSSHLYETAGSPREQMWFRKRSQVNEAMLIKKHTAGTLRKYLLFSALIGRYFILSNTARNPKATPCHFHLQIKGC